MRGLQADTFVQVIFASLRVRCPGSWPGEIYLSKISKLNKADFAYQKGISDSTFNDWIIKYQKDKDRFIGGSNSNDDVSIVSYTKPSFIELTKDNVSSQIINVDNNRSTNSIKLSYKDVTLEFNNDQLEMVLGIIRRW